MKYLIINQHTNNFGDDAAGVALVKRLLQNGHEVDVIYLWNKSGTKLPINDQNVRHHTLYSLSRDSLILNMYEFLAGKKTCYFANLKMLSKQADFVLISPCGANIGIYKDWCFLFCVCLARIFNKNVVFHLNTIGESNSNIFNFLARRVLKKCTLFVREKASVDFLKKINMNAILGVDTAFLLDKLPALESKESIIFVPTKLNNWHVDFKNKNDQDIVFNKIIPNIAAAAAHSGKNVELLPHLYNSESEHEYLEEIRDALLSENDKINVIIRKDVNTFYDYDRVISQAFFVVSMRYHGVVLSVKNGVPVISLAYENKMKECCRYSDILKYNVSLFDLDVDSLKACFNSVIEDNLAIRAKLTKRYDILNQAAMLPTLHCEILAK